MERGLLWLPLLAVFIGLAWAGWNEFQKVEAYRSWAQGFEQAKYDILAVVGVSGSHLSWGHPTRNGPVDISHIDLRQVQQIHFHVDGQCVKPDALPQRAKRCSLKLICGSEQTAEIPFTDLDIAKKWYQYLQNKIHNAASAS